MRQFLSIFHELLQSCAACCSVVAACSCMVQVVMYASIHGFSHIAPKGDVLHVEINILHVLPINLAEIGGKVCLGLINESFGEKYRQ